MQQCMYLCRENMPIVYVYIATIAWTFQSRMSWNTYPCWMPLWFRWYLPFWPIFCICWLLLTLKIKRNIDREITDDQSTHIQTEKIELSLFFQTLLWPWKWIKWVKLERCYHQVEFQRSSLKEHLRTANIKVFTKAGHASIISFEWHHA